MRRTYTTQYSILQKRERIEREQDSYVYLIYDRLLRSVSYFIEKDDITLID